MQSFVRRLIRQSAEARERDTPQEPEADDLRGSEFVLWRFYDAGGPLLTLTVRDHHELGVRNIDGR